MAAVIVSDAGLPVAEMLTLFLSSPLDPFIHLQGAWTFIDVVACHQPPTATLAKGETFCLASQGPRWETAWRSYVIGNGMFILALLLHRNGGWASTAIMMMATNDGTPKRLSRRRPRKRWIAPRTTLRRLCFVYLLGVATVNIWRGIWYILDAFLWPASPPLVSAWLSTLLGLSSSFCLCGTASLLAPPALFLRDGPSILPPPLAVTLLASYRSITTTIVVGSKPGNTTAADPMPVSAAALPNESWPVYLVDLSASFVLLPWAVVAFWRGTWYLMDYYLWGLTTAADDDDRAGGVQRSIGYSAIVALVCLVIASEDVVHYFPIQYRWGNQVVGRLRSLVLAVGAVNFWRAVWYFWDEFLGRSAIWSALVRSLSAGRSRSNKLSLFRLELMLCLSSFNSSLISLVSWDCRYWDVSLASPRLPLR
jgi:Fuseless